MLWLWSVSWELGVIENKDGFLSPRVFMPLHACTGGSMQSGDDVCDSARITGTAVARDF